MVFDDLANDDHVKKLFFKNFFFVSFQSSRTTTSRQGRRRQQQQELDAMTEVQHQNNQLSELLERAERRIDELESQLKQRQAPNQDVA